MLFPRQLRNTQTGTLRYGTTRRDASLYYYPARDAGRKRRKKGGITLQATAFALALVSERRGALLSADKRAPAFFLQKSLERSRSCAE